MNLARERRMKLFKRLLARISKMRQIRITLKDHNVKLDSTDQCGMKKFYRFLESQH